MDLHVACVQMAVQKSESRNQGNGLTRHVSTAHLKDFSERLSNHLA